MNAPDAPNVVTDLSRLRPDRTYEAENEKEFRTALDIAEEQAGEPLEVQVVILGKPRPGYAWEPLEVYWTGERQYKMVDGERRLDLPMPTQEELRSYAKKHGVRFAKGAVQRQI